MQIKRNSNVTLLTTYETYSKAGEVCKQPYKAYHKNISKALHTQVLRKTKYILSKKSFPSQMDHKAKPAYAAGPQS